MSLSCITKAIVKILAIAQPIIQTIATMADLQKENEKLLAKIHSLKIKCRVFLILTIVFFTDFCISLSLHFIKWL